MSDNLFPSRDEALEKAAQVEALISKGVLAPGTTASVVGTFEEAGRGLAKRSKVQNSRFAKYSQIAE